MLNNLISMEDQIMNYYKSELSRINIESEVVRVQVGDFDGNKTKYFNLNNVESINALRDFLNQREKNIRENKKMN